MTDIRIIIEIRTASSTVVVQPLTGSVEVIPRPAPAAAPSIAPRDTNRGRQPSLETVAARALIRANPSMRAAELSAQCGIPLDRAKWIIKEFRKRYA